MTNRDRLLADSFSSSADVAQDINTVEHIHRPSMLQNLLDHGIVNGLDYSPGMATTVIVQGIALGSNSCITWHCIGQSKPQAQHTHMPSKAMHVLCVCASDDIQLGVRLQTLQSGD